MRMRMAVTLAFLASTALTGAAFAAGTEPAATKAPAASIQMAQNDDTVPAGENTPTDQATGTAAPEAAGGESVPAGENTPIDQATGDAAPEAAGGASVPAGDNPPTDQATGGVVHTPQDTAGQSDASAADAGEYRSYSAAGGTGTAVLPAGRSAEDFMDRDIVTAEGDEVGEVVDLMVDQDDKITKVVADVGGFLGLGEKRVAIDMDDITIDQGTDDLMVSMSEAELEALPGYEEEDGVWRRSAD